MYPPNLVSVWLIITITVCVYASTCVNGPCGPGNDQCGAPFGTDAPTFHIRDLSCGVNGVRVLSIGWFAINSLIGICAIFYRVCSDPNFPFFDPAHKLYHLFYQDHLCEDQGGLGKGPVIGHVVSNDMVSLVN
jgi:hypothetical protein